MGDVFAAMMALEAKGVLYRLAVSGHAKSGDMGKLSSVEVKKTYFCAPARGGR